MIRVFVTFFKGFEGIGAAFAILLVVVLLAGAFTGNQAEVPLDNPFFALHESTSFDTDARKIGTFSDMDGTQYTEALFFKYGTDNSDFYYLKKQYTTFSGTVFVPDDRQITEYSSRLYIYGDGKRLWESSHMTAGSAPENFSVNVSDVEKLELRYNGGACTWALPIAIGNISIGNGIASGPAPSSVPMRLLDVEMKESSYICHYRDVLQRDRFGREYPDAIVYTYADENDKDVFLLNGAYTRLTGTIFVPDDRGYSIKEADFNNDDKYRIRMYGDGKLLYSSPQMVDSINPIQVSVDVSSINELTIYYFCGQCMADVSMANLHLS